MARAIWSGTISFGLLNVPVRLYSAVARRDISLREIRQSDNARIRHRKVAEGTDEEVPREEIVKAFEVTPDRYVPIGKEEMAALTPERTRAIEVQDFVALDQIDPIYFDSPYYLGPAAGAEKAYSLLARAMEDSGKVAIARFVFRNKEHLAALRPNDGVLTLTTMRFADEVVAPEELEDALPGEQPEVAEGELKMAEQLIESLTREFDPNAYRDEHREQLLALIERKAEGEDVVSAPEPSEPKATAAPDLMAALEESIAAVKGRDEGARGKARGKPKAKGATKTKGKGKGSSKAKGGSKSGKSSGSSPRGKSKASK